MQCYHLTASVSLPRRGRVLGCCILLVLLLVAVLRYAADAAHGRRQAEHRAQAEAAVGRMVASRKVAKLVALSDSTKKAVIVTPRSSRTIEWCSGSPPHLKRDPTGPKVALASYPGSGNTWLRYLIQQATGEKLATLIITKKKPTYVTPTQSL